MYGEGNERQLCVGDGIFRGIKQCSTSFIKNHATKSFDLTYGFDISHESHIELYGSIEL